MATTMDLNINRNFLEANFNGYKLSLQEIEKINHTFSEKVLQVSNKHSTYKHAKLFGLHNHLTGESVNGYDFVYFVDEKYRINKINVDDVIDIVFPIQLPPFRSATYNCVLKLPTEELAVLSDGADNLYVLKTYSRSEDHDWEVLHCEKLPVQCTLASTQFDDELNQLHCLLYEIQVSEEGSYSVFHWITLDSNWKKINCRQFKSKGDIHYAGVEAKGHTILIGSNHTFLEENKFDWLQENGCITFKMDVMSDEVEVVTIVDRIFVKSNGSEIFAGKLFGEIIADKTKWEVTNNNLKIVLVKVVDEPWEELLSVAEDNAEILNSALNANDLEECDFPDSANLILERISGEPKVTKRVNLKLQQILFASDTTLAVQQGEDVGLYTLPDFEHKGTLLAFGYIQASKQRKKFIGCSPNMEYAVICETNRHIFVYRQWKRVENGELKNRTSGKKVPVVAQQQVITSKGGDILGLYCSDQKMFVLQSDGISVYFM